MPSAPWHAAHTSTFAGAPAGACAHAPVAPIDATIATSKGKGGVVQKIDIFRDLLYIYHRESDVWETLTLEELNELSEVAVA